MMMIMMDYEHKITVCVCALNSVAGIGIVASFDRVLLFILYYILNWSKYVFKYKYRHGLYKSIHCNFNLSTDSYPIIP